VVRAQQPAMPVIGWLESRSPETERGAMPPMTDNSKRTGAAIEAHYRFLAWLVPTLEKFPKSHKFTIGDRIETIALDILESLIEATYTRERAQHLRRANLGIDGTRNPDLCRDGSAGAFLLRLVRAFRAQGHAK
jgi:hypothetical protein